MDSDIYSSAENASPATIATTLVMLLVGIVIMTAVFIPFVVQNIYEETGYDGDNGEGIGITLSKSVSTDTTYPTATIVFNESPTHILISGGYSKAIPIQDMVLAVANNQAIFVKDGHLHAYADGVDSTSASAMWSITNGKINGVTYEWAYYPATNGVYASYSNGYANSFGQDAVAVGVGGGYTAISNGTDVTNTDSPVGLIAKPVKNGDGVSEVGYTRTASQYVVNIAPNYPAYGSVSVSSISVSPGAVISANGTSLTIGDKTIIATPHPETPEYSYSFVNWSISSGAVHGTMTIVANFAHTLKEVGE